MEYLPIEGQCCPYCLAKRNAREDRLGDQRCQKASAWRRRTRSLRRICKSFAQVSHEQLNVSAAHWILQLRFVQALSGIDPVQSRLEF
jgi:hypothetical protein